MSNASGTGKRAFAAAAATALLAGCMTTPGAGEEGYGWYYRTSYGTGDAERPIGLYGLPETSASYILECAPEERALYLVSVDVEDFPGERPLTVRAGRAEYRGLERMDPPEGQAMSRTAIPLDHPVLGAIAGGLAAIRIAQADWQGRIAGGSVPARVVRECRSLASRRG